jgi:hypothetical protein
MRTYFRPKIGNPGVLNIIPEDLLFLVFKRGGFWCKPGELRSIRWIK